MDLPCQKGMTTSAWICVRHVNGKGDLFAGVEDVEILQGVAAQFRVGGRGFGRGAFFAHNQFALSHINRFVFQQILKG
jgi:hypothetical protein